MKKPFCAFALPFLTMLIFSLSTFAQNLVMNPGFEMMVSCPTGYSQFSHCLYWNNVNAGGQNCATPDLYAACAPNTWPTSANSPNCALGYQPSRNGTAHAGVILIEPSFPTVNCDTPITFDSYREYIGGQLSDTMVTGQVYSITFYVSLADSSHWACNALGMYLSPTPVNQNCAAPLTNLVPQVKYTGAPITDDVNWTRLQWDYTAVGGEKYLAIGNFELPNSISVVPHQCGPVTTSYSYYYIDDVSIIPGPSPVCPVLTTSVPAQTNVLCGSDSTGMAAVAVTGGAGPYTYGWLPIGGYQHVASNLPAGTYMAVVSDTNGCSASQTVTITEPPFLSLSVSSTPACNNTPGNASADVNGGVTPYTFHWSTGSSNQVLNNLAPGNYAVTVTDNNNCTNDQSVTITQAASLSLSTSHSAAVCGGGTATATVTVTAGAPPPYSYIWSNGQTTQTATGLAVGTYTVTVADSASAAAGFWSEDFASGGSGWSLNTNGPGVNGATPNSWIVNNVTDCGCASGNYLHVTCSGSVFCPGGGDCFYVSAPAFIFGDGTTDRVAVSPAISTVGKTNITLRFNWQCQGQAAHDYGLVRLSSDGGGTWTDLPTQYEGAASCQQAVVSIPAQYENIPNFKIGFRWINDADGDGGGPGFSVDNISLSSPSASACLNVATVVIDSTNAGAFDLTASETLLCSGDSALVCAPSGFNTYQWNTGATTQCIYTKLAGNYYVTVTQSGGCNATSNHLAIGVHPLPPVSISVNGDTLTSYNAVTYQWYNNGIIIQGATSAVYIANQSGSYQVQVTDTNGCAALSNAVIISAIKDIVEGVGVKIYPNPLASGSWQLEVGNDLIGSPVEIVDVEGRIVFNSKITNSKSEIDLEISRGVYMLRIYSPQKQFLVKLIRL